MKFIQMIHQKLRDFRPKNEALMVKTGMTHKYVIMKKYSFTIFIGWLMEIGLFQMELLKQMDRQNKKP